MHISGLNKLLAAGFAMATVLNAASALAQDAPVTLTRGTLTEVGADKLEAKTRGGQTVAIAMNADSKVLAATNAVIGDVKTDSYVGIAAAPQPDGTLKALEVTIIAESLRGMGDGHYGWDLTGGSTMTNGAVGSVLQAKGRTLVVNYKGGSKTIVVPDDVPVVSIKPADRSALKPGERIVVLSKKGEATVTANAVVAGIDGTIPPM